MNKKSILFSALIFSACLAQSQTPSGQTAGSSGQAGSQAGQTSGQRQSGQRQIGPNAPRGGIQGQPQTGQNGQPVVSGNAATNGVGANQPIDPERQRTLLQNPERPGFGGTNQVRFGTTNQPFAATNQVAFGGTNRVAPLGTNGPSPIAGNGTIINDASGAAANQNGIFLPPANGNGTVAGQNGVNQNGVTTGTDQNANNTPEVFSQRLTAALAQTGATRIYFPQTRSTVTVANQNGTILLTGLVSSQAEKQEVEARIKKTRGVTIVDNQLKVLGASPTPGALPPVDPRLGSP